MSHLNLEGGHEVEEDVKRKEVQREVWVRGAGGGKEGVEDGVEEAREGRKGRRGRGSGRGDRRKER